MKNYLNWLKSEAKTRKFLKLSVKQQERQLNCGMTNLEIQKHIDQRKVNRPPYDQLIQEIKELGYSAVGRKYNVSDNAIRKWVKTYEKLNI